MVLGILAAVVIFALGGITGKSQLAACQADGATVSTALAAYHAENPTVTTANITKGELFKTSPAQGRWTVHPVVAGNATSYAFKMSAAGGHLQVGAIDNRLRLRPAWIAYAAPAPARAIGLG